MTACLMKCRHCRAALTLPLLDLGSAPPSNAYLNAATLHLPETRYPLRLLVCEACWLVQTEDVAAREAFFGADYAYFSSYSSSWLAHAEAYVQAMRLRFGLHADSRVVEVAANDGYLLQYVRGAGIPCYGVEPTAGTAAAARAKGIDIVEHFFGLALARDLAALGHHPTMRPRLVVGFAAETENLLENAHAKLQRKGADLIVANNVLAHVPDLNDFVAGFTRLLKPQGVATFEHPHLLRLLRNDQFDTVYHEHYSYLSLSTVVRVFAAAGLCVFDVEELPTHGGSLRVYAQRADSGRHWRRPAVSALLRAEADAGLLSRAAYRGFQQRADRIKNELHAFLIGARQRGETVAAYGAAAKGNTLLNYAGIRGDLIGFVVDRNPAKQGLFMPGSRIPIVDESRLARDKPDHIVILPWNLKAEVTAQLDHVRAWGASFVTAVPALEIDRPAPRRPAPLRPERPAAATDDGAAVSAPGELLEAA